MEIEERNILGQLRKVTSSEVCGDDMGILGGGFKYFPIFTPTWTNDAIWRAYFSKGLKPPTRYKRSQWIHKNAKSDEVFVVPLSMAACSRKGDVGESVGKQDAYSLTRSLDAYTSDRIWIGLFPKTKTGWWFQRFFMFIPIWGNDPIWLIFFRWVETTN